VSLSTGSALILPTKTKKLWQAHYIPHLKLFTILCILPKLISCQTQKP
jgi:hypothetical protein